MRVEFKKEQLIRIFLIYIFNIIKLSSILVAYLNHSSSEVLSIDQPLHLFPKHFLVLFFMQIYLFDLPKIRDVALIPNDQIFTFSTKFLFLLYSKHSINLKSLFFVVVIKDTFEKYDKIKIQ